MALATRRSGGISTHGRILVRVLDHRDRGWQPLQPPSPSPDQQTRSAPGGHQNGSGRPRVIHTPQPAAIRAESAPRNERHTTGCHPEPCRIGLSTGGKVTTHKIGKTRRHSTPRTGAVEQRTNRTFRQPEPLVRSIAARVRFQAPGQSEPRDQKPNQTDQQPTSERTEMRIIQLEFCRGIMFKGRHGVVSGETPWDKTNRPAEAEFY